MSRRKRARSAWRSGRKRLGFCGSPASSAAWPSEVVPARRAGADDVPAERSAVEIFDQDLLFRLGAFDLRRAEGLRDLGGEGSPLRLKHGQAQALKLHGDGAASAADAKGGQIFPRRAGAAAPIDPAVIVKAVIFNRDDGAQQVRADLILAKRHAPLAVGRGEGGEHHAVAIGQPPRGRRRNRKRMRVGPEKNGGPEGCNQHERRGDDQNEDPSPSSPALDRCRSGLTHRVPRSCCWVIGRPAFPRRGCCSCPRRTCTRRAPAG